MSSSTLALSIFSSLPIGQSRAWLRDSNTRSRKRAASPTEPTAATRSPPTKKAKTSQNTPPNHQASSRPVARSISVQSFSSRSAPPKSSVSGMSFPSQIIAIVVPQIGLRMQVDRTRSHSQSVNSRSPRLPGVSDATLILLHLLFLTLTVSVTRHSTSKAPVSQALDREDHDMDDAFDSEGESDHSGSRPVATLMLTRA